jgi:AcrR family transcriptional regulator
MPRQIDREQRRRDILNATSQLLAEQGISGLSLRAVASRLGGSTTLITHYFATQAELLDGLAYSMLDEWEAELTELESGAGSAEERLAVLLNWLVPQDDTGIQEERARIVLLGERILGAETEYVFKSWDGRMRDLIRRHLEGVVSPDALDLRVDVLRTMTNGLTLSILEHPDSWDTDRIHAVIDCVLSDMGLAVRSSDERPSARV